MSHFAERTIGNRYFLFVVRLVLGFLFIFASIEKISQPEEFARSITYYHLLPIALVNLVALLLPWIELLAGLFLLLGILPRGSALLLLLLLGIFIVAIGISLARGLDISCGCFGTAAARKVGWAALGEDALMLLGSLLLYYFPSTLLTLEGYIRKSGLQERSNAAG
jgi:putative oxidoreductase